MSCTSSKSGFLYFCNSVTYVAIFKTFCTKPAQKGTRVVCKGSFTDLTISLVLTALFGNKPKKFVFIHQTVSSWEAHMGWAQDYTSSVFCETGVVLKIE